MATYKPGEKAPDSGELIEIGPRGGKLEGGRRTVIERGETIPPLRMRATSLSTSVAQKPLTNHGNKSVTFIVQDHTGYNCISGSKGRLRRRPASDSGESNDLRCYRRR